MVASISARGSAASALHYYDHLQRDDYYSRDGEPPGRWAGRGAERLSLAGPVTPAEFDAALQGVDPKTGERLAQVGGRGREHSAGWDMTFSAPKSVSVLWALSEGHDREAIEQAHRSAVLAATTRLEATAGWARRGRGGATRERTAALLMAQFDHHTSRESDPQLHTHAFIFNLAPRRDGSWGAIVSLELYKAQKEAGATYRRALASELERQGIRLERQNNTFRVAAIPREVERTFSKRRQAIEEAARIHGTAHPRGWSWQPFEPAVPSATQSLAISSSIGRQKPKRSGSSLAKAASTRGRRPPPTGHRAHDRRLAGITPPPRPRRHLRYQRSQRLPHTVTNTSLPNSGLVSAEPCARWINRRACPASGSSFAIESASRND
jgi:conjugative relaxase-like TrwC/TraI family protein